jgi:hypothetical protein
MKEEPLFRYDLLSYHIRLFRNRLEIEQKILLAGKKELIPLRNITEVKRPLGTMESADHKRSEYCGSSGNARKESGKSLAVSSASLDAKAVIGVIAFLNSTSVSFTFHLIGMRANRSIPVASTIQLQWASSTR